MRILSPSSKTAVALPDRTLFWSGPGILLILLILLSSIPFPGRADFKDIPTTHPSREAILYVQGKGIVTGYSDGTFRPDSLVNRAEFIKIVMGARFKADLISSCPANSQTAATFADVPKDAWFAPYVCLAKRNNFIGGYPDGTFRPASPINFAEAAKILVTVFGLPTGTDTLWFKPFTDALKQRNAVPVSLKNFDQNVSRGEMAEMIYRLTEVGALDWRT